MARDLHMTVAEMNARMPEREWRQWAAFYTLEAERQMHAENRARNRSRARGRR